MGAESLAHALVQQLSLGHSSIRTTEIYLGLDQGLTNALGDYLDITV